jgi:hypothetical protein
MSGPRLGGAGSIGKTVSSLVSSFGGGRFFDVSAAQAFEAGADLDHVHPAFRARRPHFKTGHESLLGGSVLLSRQQVPIGLFAWGRGIIANPALKAGCQTPARLLLPLPGRRRNEKLFKQGDAGLTDHINTVVAN